MRTPSLGWTDSAGDLALGAAATYRATRLVTEDVILDPARQRILERVQPGGRLAYLVTCPWCVSPYLAALLVGGFTVAPRVTRAVAAVLAWSAAAGYLSEKE